MKSKDTIMTHDEMRLYWLKRGVQNPYESDIKQAQAESSFEAALKGVGELLDHYVGWGGYVISDFMDYRDIELLKAGKMPINYYKVKPNKL